MYRSTKLWESFSLGEFNENSTEYDSMLGYFDVNHPLFPAIKNLARNVFCEKCGIYSIKLYACKGCRVVYYCSKKHQKKDWKSHKQDCVCINFESTTNPTKKQQHKTETK